MKKILNIDHTWKTSLQTRTCLTSNSVFITSLEGVQLKNIFQKTTLRTLLTTGNGNLLLLSLLPKLEKTLPKILALANQISLPFFSVLSSSTSHLPCYCPLQPPKDSSFSLLSLPAVPPGLSFSSSPFFQPSSGGSRKQKKKKKKENEWK